MCAAFNTALKTVREPEALLKFDYVLRACARSMETGGERHRDWLN